MDIKLPKLGEGSESGTVVGILVKTGDAIKKGQVILELENDKAVAPIPAPADGVVSHIHVHEGDRVAVGQVMLSLSGAANAASAEEEEPAPSPRTVSEPRLPEPEEPEEAEPANEILETTGGEFIGEATIVKTPRAGKTPMVVAASPSIRKMARELGLDLSRIKGSEYGGRILIQDVRAYIQWLQQSAFAPKKQLEAKVAPATAPKSIDFSQWGPIDRKPMTSLRKIISQRMLENWTTIPHVTQYEDADITDLLGLRKKFATAYEAKGARLTVTTFVLRALVNTLKKHPLFNASLDEAKQEIVFKEYYHIGLAVDTEAGLIVPVIRDVDKKDLVVLSKEVQLLAEKARDRKVAAEELKGGTFTLSNQGGIGGAQFTPIINKPEVAILGLGRGALKPAVRDGKIEARTLMPLCLSYDHRIIDGGSAARFISDLTQALQTFSEDAVQI